MLLLPPLLPSLLLPLMLLPLLLLHFLALLRSSRLCGVLVLLELGHRVHLLGQDLELLRAEAALEVVEGGRADRGGYPRGCLPQATARENTL